MFESKIYTYDLLKYNFSEKLQEIFKFNLSLEALDRLNISSEQTTFENDTKTFYQKTLYSSDKYDDFRELYYRFLKEYIVPLFPDEDYILVQKDPGFRVCPVNNTALGIRENENEDGPIGMHTDSEYNHPSSEINFIIAITEMWDSNSVYFESEPNKGDFEALNLRRNEFIKICANQLRHYNLKNITGQTRVSLDFRIIPYSKYDSSNTNKSIHGHRKFVDGDYFIKMNCK